MDHRDDLLRVDQMEPGPELDALVAEQVMGEPMPGYLPGERRGGSTPEWWSEAADDEPPWRPTPFSQQLSCSQSVFQKLMERGWHFDIKGDPSSGWRVMTFSNERGEVGLGNTLELALCRAALKAFNQGKGSSA